MALGSSLLKADQDSVAKAFTVGADSWTEKVNGDGKYPIPICTSAHPVKDDYEWFEFTPFEVLALESSRLCLVGCHRPTFFQDSSFHGNIYRDLS